MQPNPQERRSPREAGLSKGAAFGDGLHRDDNPDCNGGAHDRA